MRPSTATDEAHALLSPASTSRPLNKTTSSWRCTILTEYAIDAVGSSRTAAWTSRSTSSRICSAEEHVAHSTALHGDDRSATGPYLVGPLARYALNHEQFSPAAKGFATCKPDSAAVVRNPFKSLLVRTVEVAYALEEALRLIAGYEPPSRRRVTPRPRGTRLRRYRGAARPVLPPLRSRRTTACFAIGEHRSADVAEPAPDRARPGGRCRPRTSRWTTTQLQWRCEQSIRNYDPCISCATHFLKFTIERELNRRIERAGAD